MDTIGFFMDLEGEGNDSRQIRWKVRSRAKDILSIPEDQFVKYFRLNKTAFKYVLEILKDKLPPVVRTTSLTPEFKLAACLRFLAEGGYQTGTGKDFDVGMAQPTISIVLSEVFSILEKYLCPQWINLTMNEEENREAKLYFYNKSRIPGVIMCLDGTHIKIAKPPEESAHLFFNRKGAYSLNAMIICDHKQRIRGINATYPGASHDAFVWGNSDAFFLF